MMSYPLYLPSHLCFANVIVICQSASSCVPGDEGHGGDTVGDQRSGRGDSGNGQDNGGDHGGNVNVGESTSVMDSK